LALQSWPLVRHCCTGLELCMRLTPGWLTPAAAFITQVTRDQAVVALLRKQAKSGKDARLLLEACLVADRGVRALLSLRGDTNAALEARRVVLRLSSSANVEQDAGDLAALSAASHTRGMLLTVLPRPARTCAALLLGDAPLSSTAEDALTETLTNLSQLDRGPEALAREPSVLRALVRVLCTGASPTARIAAAAAFSAAFRHLGAWASLDNSTAWFEALADNTVAMLCICTLARSTEERETSHCMLQLLLDYSLCTSLTEMLPFEQQVGLVRTGLDVCRALQADASSSASDPKMILSLLLLCQLGECARLSDIGADGTFGRIFSDALFDDTLHATLLPLLSGRYPAVTQGDVSHTPAKRKGTASRPLLSCSALALHAIAVVDSLLTCWENCPEQHDALASMLRADDAVMAMLEHVHTHGSSHDSNAAYRVRCACRVGYGFIFAGEEEEEEEEEEEGDDSIDGSQDTARGYYRRQYVQRSPPQDDLFGSPTVVGTDYAYDLNPASLDQCVSHTFAGITVFALTPAVAR